MIRVHDIVHHDYLRYSTWYYYAHSHTQGTQLSKKHVKLTGLGLIRNSHGLFMHIVAYSVVTQRHLVCMQRHVKDKTLKGKHGWDYHSTFLLPYK
jgi:hypothetical protein